MTMTMKFHAVSVFLALLLEAQHVRAQDATMINDLIKPEELYNFSYSTDSDVWWRSKNSTKYYCLFRNHWTKERHPKDYPKSARWSDIVIYSSTKDFRPWLKNRATTLGVEKLVESGFADIFQKELVEAGDLVYHHASGDGFFVDGDYPDENYVYIPPVDINFDFQFLNAIAGMSPSPDWFTGFYLFDTVDQYDRTYWRNFTIFTYPWDAGTDGGQTYTAMDQDLDPPINVERILPANVPDSGAFLSPDGKEVLPVGEFNCVLHVCPVEDPYCNKPDWPPKNYCDLFKFPLCASYCDPEADTEGCEECKGNGYEPKSVFLPGCCAAGHDPRDGPGCAQLAGSSATAVSSNVVWTSLLSLATFGLVVATLC